MFCSNCGTQLPDGTKFCNNCGAQQAVAALTPVAQPVQAPVEPTPAPAAQPVYQQPVTPPPVEPAQEPKKASKKAPAKKSTRILIGVAAFFIAGLIGKFAIAPSMTSDLTTTTRPDVNNYLSDSVQQNTTSSYSSSNSAYESILTNAYIVHFNPIFGMDTASFAKKTADGLIMCTDYGYKDDIVKQWTETMYVPVNGLTDSQKSELESTYRSRLASLDALGCCSVTYSMGNNYLTVECTFSNVDLQSNYSELYYAGFNSANAPISMSATERALLNEGSAKK